MNMHAVILNKILANLIQQYIRRVTHHDRVDLLMDARMVLRLQNQYDTPH